MAAADAGRVEAIEAMIQRSADDVRDSAPSILGALVLAVVDAGDGDVTILGRGAGMGNAQMRFVAENLITECDRQDREPSAPI